MNCDENLHDAVITWTLEATLTISPQNNDQWYKEFILACEFKAKDRGCSYNINTKNEFVVLLFSRRLILRSPNIKQWADFWIFSNN